jgi:hypothetical protein
MLDKKKQTAIMAAISLYIQSEEEAALQPAPAPIEPQRASANLWGVGGRQSMMDFRNLMQLKAFHGSRLR